MGSLSKHAPTILTYLGGIGVIATSVMAVKATPKAMMRVEHAEQEKGSELTTWETIKTVGPGYIPAAIMGTATIMCIFGANVLNKRQQAALVSAYTLIDSSFKEYKQKVKELYGEETHQDIIDAIAAEKAENVGVKASGFVSDQALYVDDQCGETRLFYEEHGGRFFETTLEQVMNAEYHLNRNYVLRGFTVLNEFYDFLGIEPTNYGGELGWSIESEIYWIDFNHRKTNIKEQECIVIEMPFAPDMEWKAYY